MGRVHGKYVIRRRTQFKNRADYTGYKSILIEDFHNLCGYCGKNFDLISCARQTDHFIPLDFCKKNGRKDLEDNYENLVNSCNVCNRNKWEDWPSQSFSSSHDGHIGYVDPATNEFDEHLMRNDDGHIIPLTDVGMYMCKQLKFNIRLIDICWLVERLNDKLQKLDKKISESEVSSDTYKEYYQVNKIFREKIALLKKAKEML